MGIPPPPTFKRKVWDYKSAKTDPIRFYLHKINWHDLFLNLNVSKKSLLFTDVFFGIMAKHIPSKIITCNEKDVPWITSKVKTAIKRNHRVYREWVNRGRNSDLNKVREIRTATAKLIKQAKLAYYSKLGLKLSDPKTRQKHFWIAYKKIINKKGNTTIIDYGICVSNYKQKADIFNEYLCF